MVFIDGPPETTGKMVRYPALPLLINNLSPDTVVIVDDAFRKDEQEMIGRWLENFPEFRIEKHKTEKGTVILRRTVKKDRKEKQ